MQGQCKTMTKETIKIFSGWMKDIEYLYKRKLEKLLTQQRLSIIKEVEEMKREHDMSVDQIKDDRGVIITNCLCGAYEYNEALKDVIKKLKSLKERKDE